MLNEGSGTSPSGTGRDVRPRSWIDLRRVSPHVIEVGLRLLALAVLLVLVTIAAVLGTRAGA